MKSILIILFILFSNNVIADQITDVKIAFNKIQKEKDYKPHYATALFLLDWATTSYTIGDNRYQEINPILGEHPTHKQLNTWFITQLTMHYILNQTKFKNTWNWYLITFKSYAVINNLYIINKVENKIQLGINLKF